MLFAQLYSALGLNNCFKKKCSVMQLVKTIQVFVVFGILWICDECAGEKDFNTCTFYYWKTNWHSAVQTCERSNKQLLCYKSRKEIEDITEAFRLSAYSDAALHLWLSNKNCSSQNLVKCLSLQVKKTGTGIWHFFQENCARDFPFVCCIKDSDQTSTFPTTSTTSLQYTSNSYDTSLYTRAFHLTSSVPPKSCKENWRRGLWWPKTNVGDTSSQPCPGNSTGKAYWQCEDVGYGQWNKIGPDLKECRSFNIKDLKKMFNTSSIADIMTFLENTFDGDNKEIFGDDLADVITLMTSLPDRLLAATVFQNSSARWFITQTFVDRSAAVFDRMIELNTSWNDMQEQRRPIVGAHLLSTIDEMGLLLADAMEGNAEELNITKTNMALQVIRAEYGESIQLPQWSISDYNHQGAITLEMGYDADLNPDEGNISVIFTLYPDLSDVLPAQQNKGSTNSTSTLNSAVVSALVSQNRTAAKIQSKVIILVEHLVSQPNDTTCVFWNMQLNQWDTNGCLLEWRNDTHSECICDHLTNFAILMDYKGLLDDVDQKVFDYITLIGCSISIISLSLCVIVFSCYSYYSKNSLGLRYTIHRNLCLTLLIANFVLILGLDKTDSPQLCSIVAGALHYFFLSAFSWMLLEGVHIYLLLVVVFAFRRSHWEKYYLFGYGFPLVIVAVTALCRPTYYGTEEVCWLSIEKGTIWAFMGPVAFILLMNVAALILAQWKASSVSIKDDNIALIKRWLRVTFILFPVLGITWVFGFLHVGKHFEVAGYLFAVFNSLQGFCIFICHCLMDKKARNLVLASFKKKTASVTTGSSGIQKKQHETVDTGPRVLNSNQETLQHKVRPLSFRDTCRRHWNRWHRPWSFCFDMPISESGSYDTQKENNCDPQRPIIVQWNSLRDKVP